MIVAQRIVADIDRLDLGVGDRLPPERVMLEEYAVGRGTLRESLRFLELQGVLSIKAGPGGGPVVERPDASNLATTLVLLLQFSHGTYRTIAEARDLLEPIMAGMAAERISDASLDELRETIAAMEEGLERSGAFLEANKRFHDIIAWESGNELFGLVVDALLGILDGTALGIDYPRHRRAAIIKAHRAILRALEAHDRAGAEEAMRLHIGEYFNYAKRKFPEVLTQPVTWDSLARA
ncbi:FadR/GntR family transcriptional regulator [Conexibacter sp. CPCC 206217]|uniref:FadR/GntR family transcriptional regulator n=1 Tax=Conexibacter sp. CPCC 206217 TaxID=3064574 RepID=UPI00351C1CF4